MMMNIFGSRNQGGSQYLLFPFRVMVLVLFTALIGCGGSDGVEFNEEASQVQESQQENAALERSVEDEVSSGAGIDEDNARDEESTTDFSDAEDIKTEDSDTQTDGCEISDQMQAMLVAVNDVRGEARFCGASSYPAVAPLSWNCALLEAAQRHTKDMTDNGFMSHTGSDGSQMRDRITDTGYRYRAIGENVAAGYSTVSDVMSGWLTSPGHCSNIMSSQFTEFGADVGFNRASAYQYYWTQNFGRSRN